MKLLDRLVLWLKPHPEARIWVPVLTGSAAQAGCNLLMDEIPGCELGRKRVATSLSFVARAVAYFVLRAGKQKVKNFRRHKPHCGSNKKFKEFLINWVVLTGIEK